MCRALHSASQLGAPPSTTSIRQDARQSIHQHVQQLMQLLAASCQLTNRLRWLRTAAHAAATLGEDAGKREWRGAGAAVLDGYG